MTWRTGGGLATIYDLKPRFQALLRPLSGALVRAGLSANDVTLGALLLSVAHGAWLALQPTSAWPLLLLPATLFVRMVFNAIDGMMAKEHGQASAKGAVLNELSDVVADAALYLPFALIPGLDVPLVVLVVIAGIIAEMAGALGPMIGATALLCRAARQERPRLCFRPARSAARVGPRAGTVEHALSRGAAAALRADHAQSRPQPSSPKPRAKRHERFLRHSRQCGLRHGRHLCGAGAGNASSSGRCGGRIPASATASLPRARSPGGG